MAQLTLPQGGVITYQYTGANNGIVCADGTPINLTRTGGVSRTYSRSSITATTSHTDITDGLTNTSNFDFVMSGSPEAFYETNRTVHQGSSTVLLTRQTCYNGSGPSCTTTAISLPIAQVDTYETLNGIQQHGSTLTTTPLACSRQKRTTVSTEQRAALRPCEKKPGPTLRLGL